MDWIGWLVGRRVRIELARVHIAYSFLHGSRRDGKGVLHVIVTKAGSGLVFQSPL